MQLQMKDWIQVVYLWSDPRIRDLGREAERERKNIQYHIIKLATLQTTDPWAWIGQEYPHVHELPPPANDTYMEQVYSNKHPINQYQRSPKTGSEGTLFELRHCQSMHKAGQSHHGSSGMMMSLGRAGTERAWKNARVIQIIKGEHCAGSCQDGWGNYYYGWRD